MPAIAAAKPGRRCTIPSSAVVLSCSSAGVSVWRPSGKSSQVSSGWVCGLGLGLGAGWVWSAELQRRKHEAELSLRLGVLSQHPSGIIVGPCYQEHGQIVKGGKN